MSRSKFSSASHSAGRIALAATAVAALAVLAACSEGGVASNVAAPSLKPLSYVGPVLANAGVATVCVGASSPIGMYSFVNSNFVSAGANPNYPGSATTETPADGVTYVINKTTGLEACTDVLTRTGVPLDALSDGFSHVTVSSTATSNLATYSSTTCEIDAGNIATSPCANPSTPNMNRFHGSKTIFNFAPCAEGCIGTPQFVVGDLATGLQMVAAIRGNKPQSGLNFWGSQWWKNNPMSGYHDNGWPSFKGYATTADNFCGGTWTSRVGNSPPPPATIGDDIIVIVTSNVWKNGPDISGNIQQIITVHQDGGYGPNPGHDGNGPRTSTLCSSER